MCHPNVCFLEKDKSLRGQIGTWSSQSLSKKGLWAERPRHDEDPEQGDGLTTLSRDSESSFQLHPIEVAAGRHSDAQLVTNLK
jgi:hypothetical protein